MDAHNFSSSSSSRPTRASCRIVPHASSSRVADKCSSSQQPVSVDSSRLMHFNEENKKKKEVSGRERWKRHREEMGGGEVRIPEKWSQEHFLKDWMDFSSFDKLLAPKGLASARQALIAQSRASQRLRIF